MDIAKLINSFPNGGERYNKDVIFTHVIDLLVLRTDLNLIIQRLLELIEIRDEIIFELQHKLLNDERKNN